MPKLAATSMELGKLNESKSNQSKRKCCLPACPAPRCGSCPDHDFTPSLHLDVAFLYVLSYRESIPLLLRLFSEIVILYVQLTPEQCGLELYVSMYPQIVVSWPMKFQLELFKGQLASCNLHMQKVSLSYAWIFDCAGWSVPLAPMFLKSQPYL